MITARDTVILDIPAKKAAAPTMAKIPGETDKFWSALLNRGKYEEAVGAENYSLSEVS
jgi:hypothetical protein